jgi:2,3-dihydro-2,3-dihydroxybenzoate dehydrogenase
LPTREQVAQTCGRLLAGIARLDVLVNAAGILRMGATDALSQEDWQQTFAVNVGGAFNLFQQTMAQFRRQKAGRLSPWRPMLRIRRASA